MVENSNSSGGLIVSVTTLRGIKGVPNAKVTIFTGTPENSQIIAEDVTNSSGKTKEFLLPTKEKMLSEKPDNSALKQIPYSLYNVAVLADGYARQLNLNIPVFSGVTTLQNMDITSLSAYNQGNEPIIQDEMPQFNL